MIRRVGSLVWPEFLEPPAGVLEGQELYTDFSANAKTRKPRLLQPFVAPTRKTIGSGNPQ